ncbi:MAG: hypothetical protein OES46_02645 [Gammaproteobacteria bacterium]|nr:hypothetical protein [Gammaproteobacteria bacterium]
MPHFPGRVRSLPPFEDPFDAYKLAAAGRTEIDTLEIEFWFYDSASRRDTRISFN